MSSGQRPDNRAERPAEDVTNEREEVKKSWMLGTTILRGVFFLLALGFTCASLIYLNGESEWHSSAIYAGCLVGTFIISFAGLMRGSVFDNITLILVSIIFISLIRFEYREDLVYLKVPERIKDSAVVASLPGLDSVKAVRFRDARVLVSDTVILSYNDEYSSSQLLAPVCDTWRDSTKGDSIFAFAVGYSYDLDHTSLINQWLDTCRMANLVWQKEMKEFYAPMVEQWKKKTGRAVSADPAFLEFTCLPGLNDGQASWELIGIFFVLVIPWIVLISIVRGITALIRKA